ncbi:MAG: efflux RND transporter periplasmic adaptor subunit [Isosphaeraceae bacterium]
MIISRCLKAASVLLVAGATVVGVDWLAPRGASIAQAQARPEQKPEPELVTYEVKPGKLRVTVVDRGSLESARNQDVYSNVEGGTTIIRIAQEGTRVKKGETICELDSAPLKDQLIDQRIKTQSAKLAAQNARLAREVAEIALSEYKEGISKQESTVLRGEISALQSAVQKAERRIERTRQGRRRLNDLLAGKGGAKTPDEIVTDLDIDDRLDDAEQSLLRDRIALEVLRTKQDVLQKYTRDKTIKTLEVDVDQRHSEELARQVGLDLETKRQARLERQIAACTLKAPIDGMIVYRSQIEEGATVRERQKILSIPDLSRMQVNTMIRELHVDKLVPNQKAKIRVDAFSDVVLNGVVVEIAPVPDSNRFSRQDIKVYPTHVRIDDPIPGLRPGMTAEVEILVNEADNVLSVPVEAVLVYEKRYYDQLAVKKPGGGFEWRDVVFGMGDEKFVEVREGLRSGEAVILNPISLMSDEEKRARFSAPTKPAARRKGNTKPAPKAKIAP